MASKIEQIKLSTQNTKLVKLTPKARQSKLIQVKFCHQALDLLRNYSKETVNNLYAQMRIHISNRKLKKGTMTGRNKFVSAKKECYK